MIRFSFEQLHIEFLEVPDGVSGIRQAPTPLLIGDQSVASHMVGLHLSRSVDLPRLLKSLLLSTRFLLFLNFPSASACLSHHRERRQILGQPTIGVSPHETQGTYGKRLR